MKEKRQIGELELDEKKELHDPTAMYARNTEIPTFFGQPILKGSFNQLDGNQLSTDIPVKTISIHMEKFGVVMPLPGFAL
jgi:hypothetical protein